MNPRLEDKKRCAQPTTQLVRADKSHVKSDRQVALPRMPVELINPLAQEIITLTGVNASVRSPVAGREAEAKLPDIRPVRDVRGHAGTQAGINQVPSAWQVATVDLLANPVRHWIGTVIFFTAVKAVSSRFLATKLPAEVSARGGHESLATQVGRTQPVVVQVATRGRFVVLM